MKKRLLVYHHKVGHSVFGSWPAHSSLMLTLVALAFSNTSWLVHVPSCFSRWMASLVNCRSQVQSLSLSQSMWSCKVLWCLHLFFINHFLWQRSVASMTSRWLASDLAPVTASDEFSSLLIEFIINVVYETNSFIVIKITIISDMLLTVNDNNYN